jgi:signal transduction histidine kinase
MSHEQTEKSAGELRIELRHVREAVGEILDDYEQTAKTLDSVTAQVDGLEPTDHAGNVQVLKGDLLDALEGEADTITPPWEREGFDSKQAWLDEDQ